MTLLTLRPVRWLSVAALAVVGGALLAAGPVGPAEPAHSAPATRGVAPAAHRFTIGTHNVAGGLDPGYPSFAQVIGFQEVKDRPSGLDRLDDSYRVLRGKGGAGQVPIAFRADRFSLVPGTDRHRKTHDGFKALPNGRLCTSGPGCKGVSPSRWVHSAVLASDVTGGRFAVINTHFVSGAWAPGDRRAKEYRQRLWRRHLADLVEVYQRFRGRMPVLLVGDMNRRSKLSRFDGPDGLRGLCYLDIARRTTVGLDHVYATCGTDPRRGTELEKYGSDIHHALRGRVTVRS